MTRKSVQIALKGGKGLRQRVWDRLRLLDTDFCLLDVTVGDESKETVRDYLIGLERAGYLEVTNKGAKVGNVCTAKKWKLAKNAGIEAPRVRRDGTAVTMGLAQEQMWRTLRMLKGDTNARELAAHASTDAIKVAEVAAGDYLRNLHRASYLQCTVVGKGLGRKGVGTLSRYRLISNTGPKPPMVQRTDAIYDPNLQEVVWIKPIDEETAIYGS